MGFNRFFGASILSLAILAGCGGGGDGTAPAAGGGGGGGGTTTSGQLTNSPIDGVPYSAAPSGLTGTTMNGGMFNFQAGDTVTFNIAGVEIAVPGGTRITPQTLAEELANGNATTQANILANLTTLFQTLDNDGDPENGSITIRAGATLGNTDALLANLDDAPTTFQGELSSAITMGENLRDEGQPAPTVVTDIEAMLRFYRNELQGSWRLVNTVEDGVTRATSADYQVLLSFDVGNSDAAESGVVNSFVFSEYDITDPADEFAFVGVGTTNYDSESGDFQFTTLPRELINGNGNSSTENDAVLYTSKVALNGNQLVLTLTEGEITIVATFERFNNVKDSLVGTWYEVFAEGDAGVTPVAAPNQGRVSFGPDVGSVFYYFLSSSRVMLVFTDLNDEFISDERNGVVLANYSLNSAGTSLTFTDILLDTVSVDPVNNPALEDGLTVAVGEAMLNDTNRELTDSTDPMEEDVFTIFRILSLSERVGAFEQAAPAEAVEAR